MQKLIDIMENLENNYMKSGLKILKIINMNVIDIEKLNQLISRTDINGNDKVKWLTDFIDGREFQQQEQLYSEEEVEKLIELHSDFIDSKIDYEGINNATTAISNPEWNDKEWFENFKKK